MEKFSPGNFEKKKHLSIEEQFGKKEILHTLGGKIELVDISLEQRKTEIPALVAPGFGAGIESFKNVLRVLAENGRRAIGIEQPRGVKDLPENASQMNEHPIEEVRKAAALLETLKEKNIGKIDAIGHSEGTLYVLLAAKIAPERFRSIIISNPAGLVGKDNLIELVKRSQSGPPSPAGPNFPGEIEKQNVSGIKGRVLNFWLEHPLTAFRDVKAISKSDVHKLLKELHAEGIHIAVIAGVDDTLFPMDRMQGTLKKEDELDGFLSIKGGHEEIFKHSEHYARVVDKLLSALQQKERKTE